MTISTFTLLAITYFCVNGDSNSLKIIGKKYAFKKYDQFTLNSLEDVLKMDFYIHTTISSLKNSDHNGCFSFTL